MNSILMSIALTLSAGLSWLGIHLMGWIPALALSSAVLVHEAGHWLFWRLRAQRALIVISPFLGLTIPIGVEDDDRPAPFEEGILFLAGCMFSVFVAAVFSFVDFLTSYTFITSTEFWFLFYLMLVISSLLNALVCLPIVDAGHVLLLLVSGKGYNRTLFLSGVWVLSGAATFQLMPPWCACALIGISLWLFFPKILPCPQTRIPIAVDGDMIKVLPRIRFGHGQRTLNSVEKRILGGLWASTILAPIALLLLHPIFRRICWKWLLEAVGASF